MKKFKFFIGIDVSKSTLDIAVYSENNFKFHLQVMNNTDAIAEFLKILKSDHSVSVSQSVFGLEHTGIYANHLLDLLAKKKANIVVENAMQIRNSLGTIRGKNDKIDAMRIAQYLYRIREDFRFWEPKRLIIEQLAHLATLRERLITTQKALLTPLAEGDVFLNKTHLHHLRSLCSGTVASIAVDAQRLNHEIQKLIDSDERLKRLHTIITSVSGVGSVTAVQIIIHTNEFKSITEAKKFACFAGVVPFTKSSGIIEGKGKVSPVANRKMKSLLHLCALSAIRSDVELKSYYKKKTAIEGKAKLATLNAIRNKIVLRVYACVLHDRIFEKKNSETVS